MQIIIWLVQLVWAFIYWYQFVVKLLDHIITETVSSGCQWDQNWENNFNYLVQLSSVIAVVDIDVKQPES